MKSTLKIVLTATLLLYYHSAVALYGHYAQFLATASHIRKRLCFNTNKNRILDVHSQLFNYTVIHTILKTHDRASVRNVAKKTPDVQRYSIEQWIHIPTMQPFCTLIVDPIPSWDSIANKKEPYSVLLNGYNIKTLIFCYSLRLPNIPYGNQNSKYCSPIYQEFVPLLEI